MAKEYPIQRPVHPLGHAGIWTDCECTAMRLAGASQTVQREINLTISLSEIGIMGRGCSVESQNDLSSLFA